MDKKKVSFLMIFSLAVVLALVLVAARRPYSPPPSAEAPRITHAPEGEFIPTLPRELILDTSANPKENRVSEEGVAETSESYSIDYGDLGLQSSGNYESERSMVELAAMYESYLEENGWTIENRTNYPTSRGFAAKKGDDGLSIAIIDRGNRRYVSVNYLAK